MRHIFHEPALWTLQQLAIIGKYSERGGLPLDACKFLSQLSDLARQSLLVHFLSFTHLANPIHLTYHGIVCETGALLPRRGWR